MEKSNNETRNARFLRKNWWKLTVLLVLLYIVFQKDLSFQVNLSKPAPAEELPPTPGTTGKAEKMTEKVTSEPFFKDLFELPALFGRESGEKKEVALLRALRQVPEDIRLQYLKRFARVAISERKKYNIPSSVILGCALLESTAGTRSMAATGNNQFALPCADNWKGQSGIYQGKCYRHYENAWSSFRDHSEYLTRRFPELMQLETTDYRNWAAGLERQGYGAKGFAGQLVKIIEQYQLHELDLK